MGEALKKEELSKLARLYGVALNYFDCEGRFIRVSNETVLALLRSMGVDPERSFSEHIEELRLKRLKAALPPLSVVPQHISKVAIFINLLE